MSSAVKWQQLYKLCPEKKEHNPPGILNTSSSLSDIGIASMNNIYLIETIERIVTDWDEASEVNQKHKARCFNKGKITHADTVSLTWCSLSLWLFDPWIWHCLYWNSDGFLSTEMQTSQLGRINNAYVDLFVGEIHSHHFYFGHVVDHVPTHWACVCVPCVVCTVHFDEQVNLLNSFSWKVNFAWNFSHAQHQLKLSFVLFLLEEC